MLESWRLNRHTTKQERDLMFGQKSLGRCKEELAGMLYFPSLIFPCPHECSEALACMAAVFAKRDRLYSSSNS